MIDFSLLWPVIWPTVLGTLAFVACVYLLRFLLRRWRYSR